MSSTIKQIIISATLAVVIVFVQFGADCAKHCRLVSFGVTTNAQTVYDRVGKIAVLYFITEKGDTVHHGYKCATQKDYMRNYEGLKVIYNPSKPMEFETLPDFHHYHLWYRIFFFFGVVGTLLFWLFYKIINVCKFFYWQRH